MPQKFLVVSNNATTTKAIQSALNNGKHQIILAQDGLEAVDLALDRQPDAVFLSIALGQLTGIEVARALRAISLTAHVPIIFLAEDDMQARHIADAKLANTDCLIAPYQSAKVQACADLAHSSNGRNEQRAEPENAWMMALLDPLTRLYHRRYFMHRLAYEAARSARYHIPLALLLVDVDNLTEINHQYGIVTGDAVLMEVAEQLKKLTRMSDMLGRCDTQDFGILAPQIQVQGARDLALRIVQSISVHHFVLEKLDVHVTVSVGVAHVPGNDLTENLALLGRAQAALERAKKAGKNRSEEA
jgi:two-component system, cell cycle response regulator